MREPTEVTKVYIFKVRDCARSESFLVFILLLYLRPHLKAEVLFWRILFFSRANPSFEDLAVFTKTAKT